MASNEKAALKHVIKADRRFQFIRFLALLLIIAAAGFSLYSIQQKVDRLVTNAGVLVNRAIEEGKIRDLESISYHTCILQVPLDERTPEIIKQCFLANDLPGGLDPNTFAPKLLNLNTQGQLDASPSQLAYASSLPSNSQTSFSSSPQNTQPEENVQPENPQPPEEPNVVESIVMSIMSFIRGLL